MTWALVQVALSMMLTGVNVVAGKVLAQALPVPVVLFLRCALAGLVLAPFALRAWPGRGVALNLLVQAAVGTVGYNSLLLAGLRRTGALEAGFVLAALPAVMAIGASVLFGERLSPRRRVAVALASLGMMALAARTGSGGGSLAGDALVFAAVGCEAGYMLLAKYSAGRIGLWAGAFWMQLFSLFFLSPWALADWPTGLPPAPIAGLLVFHSLTASVLAVVLWYGGMRRAPAHLAGVFTIFLPATAAVTAVLALGERMSVALAIGFGLMGVSILLATWPERKTDAVQKRAEFSG
jgi:drug/metabolite transporter (DMT)-like permease